MHIEHDDFLSILGTYDYHRAGYDCGDTFNNLAGEQEWQELQEFLEWQEGQELIAMAFSSEWALELVACDAMGVEPALIDLDADIPF